MVLDDMCVLVSATTPNSCKLAVYEGEVLWKSSTFLVFTPSGEEKKMRETEHSSYRIKTHRRDLGQGMEQIQARNYD